MSNKPDNETIRKVMAELGKRGGKKASKKKSDAVRKNLEKARANRWPKGKARAALTEKRRKRSVLP